MQVDSLPAEPQGKPKNTGASSRFLLQGFFLTQGLNPGLLHGRWILYPLSHQGSPRSGLSYVQMKQTEVVVSCGDLLHYVLTPNTHSFCTCEVSPKDWLAPCEEIQVWKRVNRFRVKAGSRVPTSPAGSRGSGTHLHSHEMARPLVDAKPDNRSHSCVTGVVKSHVFRITYGDLPGYVHSFRKTF